MKAIVCPGKAWPAEAVAMYDCVARSPRGCKGHYAAAPQVEGEQAAMAG